MVNKYKKIFSLSLLTVLAAVFFFSPMVPLKKASAFGVPVIDVKQAIKEFALDVAARFLARKFLSSTSNGVIDSIQRIGREPSRGQTGPAFVQDWRQFLQQGQYRGENIFRAKLADAISGQSPSICPYMRTTLATIFNAGSLISNFNASRYRVNSLQDFALRNRCTLPGNFNPNAFKQDFSKGGWEAWNKLIKPENNLYGVIADSVKELENQRRTEEEADKSEAGSGSGFTGRRQPCQGWGANTRCVVLGQVLTPADVIKSTAAQVNTSEFDWLADSDELSEVILNVASLVSNRLSGFFAANSRAQDTPTTGSGKTPQQIQQECMNSCINDLFTCSADSSQNPNQEPYDQCVIAADTECANICANTQQP